MQWLASSVNDCGMAGRGGNWDEDVEEARSEDATQKSYLPNSGTPTFDPLLMMLSRRREREDLWRN